MDTEKYQSALKLAQSKKPKDGYMVIEFGYSNKIILPHKDGIAFMSVLNSAEHFEENYSSVSRIAPFDRSKLSASIMSAEEYLQYKMAAILNVPVNDIKEYEKQAA